MTGLLLSNNHFNELMIIYLVYTSKATRPMSEAELSGLLKQSRENNKRDGITGLLLYKAGQFMQLLEGEEATILRCYDRIKADKRHTDVLKLTQKPIRTPAFAKWEMAFQNVDSTEANEEISSFLSEPYSSQPFGSNMHEGIFLLLSFRKQTQEL